MNDTNHGLQPDWDWIGRKRDVTDTEYSVFAPLLLNWLPFVTLHLIVNQLLLKTFPRSVRIFSIGLSFVWLCSCMGLRLSFILFLQPLITFYLFKYGSFVSVWIFFLISLIASQTPHPLGASARVAKISTK